MVEPLDKLMAIVQKQVLVTAAMGRVLVHAVAAILESNHVSEARRAKLVAAQAALRVAIGVPNE